MPEFPEGTLRWAPALLEAREYPVERLAALEERSAKVLAELGVTAPAAPRRKEDVDEVNRDEKLSRSL